MRTLARIGLVAAFATVALVGGCNKSARVESSAAATKTCADKAECSKSAACAEGKVCEKGAAACCNGDKAAKAPAAKQN